MTFAQNKTEINLICLNVFDSINKIEQTLMTSHQLSTIFVVNTFSHLYFLRSLFSGTDCKLPCFPVCSGTDQVNVRDLDSGAFATILDRDLFEPGSIIVDPREGQRWMYFTDWGFKHGLCKIQTDH